MQVVDGVEISADEGGDGEWERLESGYNGYNGGEIDGGGSSWPPRIIGQKGSGVTYLYLSQALHLGALCDHNIVNLTITTIITTINTIDSTLKPPRHRIYCFL